MNRKKQKIVGYVVYSIGIFALGLMFYFLFLQGKAESQHSIDVIGLDVNIPDPEEEHLLENPKEVYAGFDAELLGVERKNQDFLLGSGDRSLVRTPENDRDIIVDVVPSRRNATIDVMGDGGGRATTTNTPPTSEWSRQLEFLAEQDRQREEEQRRQQQQAETERRAELQRREEQQAALHEQMRVQQELLNAALLSQMGIAPTSGGAMPGQEQRPLPTTPEQRIGSVTEEIIVQPITEQGDGIVSSLRRTGFHGTAEMTQRRNTIAATVNGRQVVSDGQSVRIRLREPMQVGRKIIPTGTVVVGIVNIGVDRAFITVNSIESGGVITPVKLTAFDHDGQHGLFVPGSMENEALREIGGEIATAIGSAGTNAVSMFNQQSAMEQLQGDITRGAVQGTARYVGRRIQQIRVILQDNHRLFLVATN
jgi:conjugative transposon TraM protein